MELANIRGFVPSMEVLTSKGFKSFKDCGEDEILFLVRKDLSKVICKKYSFQSYEVEDFNLFTFKNNRISFELLFNQKIYARKASSDSYEILPMDKLSNYSDFMPFNISLYDKSLIWSYYKIFDNKLAPFNDEISDFFCFGFVIGYLLSKGSVKGTNIICQTSKLESLKLLCAALDKLGLFYKTSITELANKEFYVCSVEYTEEILEYLVVYNNVNTRNYLSIDYEDLTKYELLGMYFGITYASGKPLKDRKFQYVYTRNKNVADIFQYISFVFGYDCHLNKRNSKGKNTLVCSMNFNDNTVIKISNKFKDCKTYTGNVFQIKGGNLEDYFIILRGNKFKFSFLCPMN